LKQKLTNLQQDIFGAAESMQEKGLIPFIRRYFIFFLFLITKILDWRYSTESQTRAASVSDQNLVKPPYQEEAEGASKSPKKNTNTSSKHGTAPKFCAICKKSYKNPTLVTVSGYVYCFVCIEEYVKKHSKCPLSNLACTNQNLARVYDE
jgi:peroxin-12